ncbi:MAG: bifunctional hydroxymethylpyrimidine kinase/phosphomethylpyrimidine kinase [Parabacteroides merdae]
MKTFSALGVFGTSAITSITAQNTQGSKRHTRSFSRNRRRANSCRIRRLNRRCR